MNPLIQNKKNESFVSQRKHIKRMKEVWLCLKKSLHCKPHSSEVHDPVHDRSAQRKKQGKDFTHERKNHSKKQQDSPISQGNSVILNPVTHEIVLDTSSGDVKFCPCCPFPHNEDGKDVGGSHRSTKRTIISGKTHYVDCDEWSLFSKPKVVLQKDSNNDPPSLDTAEKHDILEEHSVIKLHKEDSSWQIIERICQTSYTNSDSKVGLIIECVLKVQIPQKTFACFEECREIARINAEKLEDKHPRCLVDGNELLRFHGTTIACSLGINDFNSSLCTFDQCGLCQILKHGFSNNNQEIHGEVGVFTTSTSEKAFDTIDSSSDEKSLRKCVIVCRVIAGRVHDPLEEVQEIITDSRFDSLVKKISKESDIEELYVLNPKAILPCFVVIYKL